MKNDFRGSARASVLNWSNSKIQVIVPPELAMGPSDIRLG